MNRDTDGLRVRLFLYWIDILVMFGALWQILLKLSWRLTGEQLASQIIIIPSPHVIHTYFKVFVHIFITLYSHVCVLLLKRWLSVNKRQIINLKLGYTRSQYSQYQFEVSKMNLIACFQCYFTSYIWLLSNYCNPSSFKCLVFLPLTIDPASVVCLGHQDMYSEGNIIL